MNYQIIKKLTGSHNFTLFVFMNIKNYDIQNNLYKNLNISYSTLFDVIIHLEKIKLITITKIGRVKKLNYTQEGLQIFNYLESICKLLTNINEVKENEQLI